MFRTVGDQVSLWESVLPAELLVLPGELGRVDTLLDGPMFFAPFAPFFDPRIGRPSTPIARGVRRSGDRPAHRNRREAPHQGRRLLPNRTRTTV